MDMSPSRRWIRAVAVCWPFVLAATPALRAQSASSTLRLTVDEIWDSSEFDMAGGLTRVVGLAETRDGAIWIIDRVPGGSSRVMIHRGTSPPGNTRVVGRVGDGPGEVLRPTRIALAPNGDVAVYDMGRVGIEMYSPDGEPRGRVQFPVRVEWTKGFAVLASGDFVLSGPVPGIDFAIHQFGREGRLLRSFGAPAVALEWRARMVATGGALHALSDGSLLYSQGAPHNISRYAAMGDGEEGAVRQVAALAGLLEAPGDAAVTETVGESGRMTRSFNVFYPQSVAVFELAGGLILNVVRIWDEGESLWQLFDPGLATDAGAPVVAETRVGVAYLPMFKCANGDILATRRDPATETSVMVRLRVGWDN